ncbi:PRC-barrel domain-containing protein [Thermoanaerobacterium thermosaccharolyticum]|uniref:PRC-barrel domain-containing protein n=1 Tax=Thermoanaerobacterium thermosaccharolyticum TaxID=1517 RepID=UPI003DA8130F
MIFVKDIIGMPIISSEDNKIIGSAKNVLYGDLKDKIIGVLIEEGGILKSPKMVENKNIISINKQVYIDNKDAIKDLDVKSINDVENGNNDIINKDVYDNKGNYWGKIYDLILDEKKRIILYAEISKGFSSDLFKGLKIVSIECIEKFGGKIIIKDGATFFTRGGLNNLIKV